MKKLRWSGLAAVAMLTLAAATSFSVRTASANERYDQNQRYEDRGSYGRGDWGRDGSQRLRQRDGGWNRGGDRCRSNNSCDDGRSSYRNRRNGGGWDQRGDRRWRDQRYDRRDRGYRSGAWGYGDGSYGGGDRRDCR